MASWSRSRVPFSVFSVLRVELRGRIRSEHSAKALGGLTAPPVKCSSLRLCFMERPEPTATRGWRRWMGGVSTGWEVDLPGSRLEVPAVTGSELKPLVPAALGDSSELLSRRWASEAVLGDAGELTRWRCPSSFFLSVEGETQEGNTGIDDEEMMEFVMEEQSTSSTK